MMRQCVALLLLMCSLRGWVPVLMASKLLSRCWAMGLDVLVTETALFPDL